MAGIVEIRSARATKIGRRDGDDDVDADDICTRGLMAQLLDVLKYYLSPWLEFPLYCRLRQEKRTPETLAGGWKTGGVRPGGEEMWCRTGWNGEC